MILLVSMSIVRPEPLFGLGAFFKRFVPAPPSHGAVGLRPPAVAARPVPVHPAPGLRPVVAQPGPGLGPVVGLGGTPGLRPRPVGGVGNRPLVPVPGRPIVRPGPGAVGLRPSTVGLRPSTAGIRHSAVGLGYAGQPFKFLAHVGVA